MNAQVAYLDEAMMRALDRKKVEGGELTAEQKLWAKQSATQLVAGFEFLDEEKQAKVEAEWQKENLESIEGYLHERDLIYAQLRDLGVTPLAVLPKKVWTSIAKQSGLYTLKFGIDGQVYPSDRAFTVGWVKWMALKADWKRMVAHLFPDGYSYNHGRHPLTPVLPEAPREVVDVLRKLKGNLSRELQTAVVPEALGFKENLDDVRGTVLRQMAEERRVTLLSRDPIVLAPFRNSVAVVAQFGDFPVEKAVVDAAVEAEGALPFYPKG
jgi:hypothetical protein